MFRTICLAAGLAVAAGCTASAATYKATSNIKEGAGNHSLWFSNDNNGNPVGATGSRPNHFKFELGGTMGRFETSGSTARLWGQVANAGGQAFDLDLNLVEYTGTAGYKRIFGGQDVSGWTLYDLDPNTQSTLTFASGPGAPLQSFIFSALRGSDSNGDYYVQFGIGANDKDPNVLGLSTWFTLTDVNGGSGCGVSTCSYAGDINVVLATMPLPSSALMLLSVLGGAGVIAHRRRRRSA